MNASMDFSGISGDQASLRIGDNQKPAQTGKVVGGNQASFKDVLGGLVDEVNSLQKDADASIQGFVRGDGTNIHDVTVKMEEAGVAFELMMEIRNKLVDAYQQILRMQP